MKAIVKRVSEITGFSPSTVSNALRHKKGVNKETAEKIEMAARTLGYEVEERISKIKFVIFKNSGNIVEDTPYFQVLIEGAEKECRTQGIEMTIYNIDKRDADYKEQVKWLQNDSNSMIILLGNEMMDEDVSLVQRLTKPFIVIDYYMPGYPFDCILGNNMEAAMMATDYLVMKGHKKIGYLCGNIRIKPFHERSLGYQTSLKKAGLPLEKKYKVTMATTMDGAYEDMMKYLSKKPELPTAFFADNDIIALGAMRALEENGLHIPEDVSIIGYDDLPYSSVSFPPLTTIRVPKEEMGRIAVKHLCDALETKISAKVKIQVSTEFIERKSVKDIRSGMEQK